MKLNLKQIAVVKQIVKIQYIKYHEIFHSDSIHNGFYIY